MNRENNSSDIDNDITCNISSPSLVGLSIRSVNDKENPDFQDGKPQLTASQTSLSVFNNNNNNSAISESIIKEKEEDADYTTVADLNKEGALLTDDNEVDVNQLIRNSSATNDIDNLQRVLKLKQKRMKNNRGVNHHNDIYGETHSNDISPIVSNQSLLITSTDPINDTIMPSNKSATSGDNGETNEKVRNSYGEDIVIKSDRPHLARGDSYQNTVKGSSKERISNSNNGSSTGVGTATTTTNTAAITSDQGRSGRSKYIGKEYLRSLSRSMSRGPSESRADSSNNQSSSAEDDIIINNNNDDNRSDPMMHSTNNYSISRNDLETATSNIIHEEKEEEEEGALMNDQEDLDHPHSLSYDDYVGDDEHEEGEKEEKQVNLNSKLQLPLLNSDRNIGDAKRTAKLDHSFNNVLEELYDFMNLSSDDEKKEGGQNLKEDGQTKEDGEKDSEKIDIISENNKEFSEKEILLDQNLPTSSESNKDEMGKIGEVTIAVGINDVPDKCEKEVFVYNKAYTPEKEKELTDEKNKKMEEQLEQQLFGSQEKERDYLEPKEVESEGEDTEKKEIEETQSKEVEHDRMGIEKVHFGEAESEEKGFGNVEVTKTDVTTKEQFEKKEPEEVEIVEETPKEVEIEEEEPKKVEIEGEEVKSVEVEKGKPMEVEVEKEELREANIEDEEPKEVEIEEEEPKEVELEEEEPKEVELEEENPKKVELEEENPKKVEEEKPKEVELEEENPKKVEIEEEEPKEVELEEEEPKEVEIEDEKLKKVIIENEQFEKEKPQELEIKRDELETEKPKTITCKETEVENEAIGANEATKEEVQEIMKVLTDNEDEMVIKHENEKDAIEGIHDQELKEVSNAVKDQELKEVSNAVKDQEEKQPYANSVTLTVGADKDFGICNDKKIELQADGSTRKNETKEENIKTFKDAGDLEGDKEEPKTESDQSLEILDALEESEDKLQKDANESLQILEGNEGELNSQTNDSIEILEDIDSENEEKHENVEINDANEQEERNSLESDAYSANQTSYHILIPCNENDKGLSYSSDEEVMVNITDKEETGTKLGEQENENERELGIEGESGNYFNNEKPQKHIEHDELGDIVVATDQNDDSVPIADKLNDDIDDLLNELEFIDDSEASKLLNDFDTMRYNDEKSLSFVKDKNLRNTKNIEPDTKASAVTSSKVSHSEISDYLSKQPVYIYTSLAGGGFHMPSRTNRLAQILTANRIPFTYRDLGTDEEAKKVWKRYSRGRMLPGVVRGKDDIIGNWEEIEDANEEYRLRELIYETL
ncbi:uncharacterized protein SCODWIG_03468 [Saccharomycodes ludwigii]|uniref:Uncharacterized protein n=1 Tax=Saccharomycodes ludwigii TaxID=36035 RepID=A0A376BAR0_9ASCO|nr:uncharacterized protein SCODWIG_03468 [Saccharomycodes ludwigii]